MPALSTAIVRTGLSAAAGAGTPVFHTAVTSSTEIVQESAWTPPKDTEHVFVPTSESIPAPDKVTV